VTYSQTLDWMFNQLPMYQRKGSIALKAKLDNIIKFSHRLGNPHKNFKSIHVAGTNGKGSSSHMLASILQEAGYKVGLYTSPHLKDFRERIRVNGKKISKKAVKVFIAEHQAYLSENELSFFEMTVGMAFAHYVKEKVDIAIIEVGLGGRLDSTNIIRPEVSLITNIGLDHVAILGHTLKEIATEKAGIIKERVPVVISETQSEIKAIFDSIATQKQTSITYADQEIKGSNKTDLLGDYQQKNIKGVLICLDKLKGFIVTKKHISKGLRNITDNTGLLGRWQVLSEKPKIICDTAHNKEGLSLVLAQIQKQKFSKLHMVLGFVTDKDLKEILSLFPKEALYYFVKPDVPRGLDEKTFRLQASYHDLKGASYTTVKKGLKRAIKRANKEDLIYVGGSTFVVAEIV